MFSLGCFLVNDTLPNSGFLMVEAWQVYCRGTTAVMENELESPWSRLISTEDRGEVVPVVGSKFLIGRKKSEEDFETLHSYSVFEILDLVDYVISGNQHVSGRHCELIRGVGSVAYLKDVSSNGTLLNGKRITKNAEVGAVYSCFRDSSSFSWEVGKNKP